MKQLLPSDIDEYIAEHKVGDTVSGRVIELSGAGAVVELGDGIKAACAAGAAAATVQAEKPEGKVDLSSLSSMLKDRWKGNSPAASAKPEALAEGQIRSFKIVKLGAEAKKIVVELA